MSDCCISSAIDRVVILLFSPCEFAHFSYFSRGHLVQLRTVVYTQLAVSLPAFSPAYCRLFCVRPSFLPSFLLVLLYYIVFSSLAYCVCCTWILLKPFSDSYSLIKSWVDFLDLKTIKNYMCLNSLVSGGRVTRELCIPAGS